MNTLDKIRRGLADEDIRSDVVHAVLQLTQSYTMTRRTDNEHA